MTRSSTSNRSLPAIVGAVVLGVHVLIRLLPIAEPLRGDIQSIWYLAAPAVAVAACWYVLPVTRDRERQAWLLILGATLAFVVSELYWAYDAIAVHSSVPGGVGAHAISLLGYLLLAGGIFRIHEAAYAPVAKRVGNFIDVLMTTMFVCLVLVALVIGPLRGGAAFTSGVDIIDFLTIALDIVLLLMLLGLGHVTRGSWLVYLALFLSAWTAADFTFVVLTSLGIYETGWLGTGTDLVWMLGYLFVAMAAWTRRRRTPVRHLTESATRLTGAPEWPVVIGLTSAALGAPLALFEMTHASIQPGDQVFFAAVCAALTSLMAARIILYFVENRALTVSSTIDPLTGVHNFRFFQAQLDRELVSATKNGHPLSLLMLDLDEFDYVNNVFGHQAGDERLRTACHRMSSAIRGIDTLCRLGGDEFAIILPGVRGGGAMALARRLADKLREPDGVCSMTTSASIGVAEYPKDTRDRADLRRKADEALYQAKFDGGDQAVRYTPGIEAGLSDERRAVLVGEQSYLKLVRMLATAVDARDECTQSHSLSVAGLVNEFAPHVDLPASSRMLLRTAAMLHDVGKIGVADAALRKPGPLTAEERREVEQHSVLGTQILGAIPRPEILPWIRAHHERWDGEGYPDRLTGSGIPVEARMICICDAYDSITSERPYRAARSAEAALAEIEACSGTQFDPELVPIFVEMIRARESAATTVVT